MPRMLVNRWCWTLWARFHCEGGEACCQFQVSEWIFGSRIQSHCPCRTLCPISMLSRILATERQPAPISQAGRRLLPTIRARRAATSSPVRAAITRRM